MVLKDHTRLYCWSGEKCDESGGKCCAQPVTYMVSLGLIYITACIQWTTSQVNSHFNLSLGVKISRPKQTNPRPQPKRIHLPNCTSRTIRDEHQFPFSQTRTGVSQLALQINSSFTLFLPCQAILCLMLLLHHQDRKQIAAKNLHYLTNLRIFTAGPLSLPEIWSSVSSLDGSYALSLSL
jgi:hypothetical protein